MLQVEDAEIVGAKRFIISTAPDCFHYYVRGECSCHIQWFSSSLLMSLLKKYVCPDLNCWLNLVASCLDDENEIPLKVILCLALFSAINSFNSSPQLDQVSLLVHDFNKGSPFLPFVHTDTVLDVFIQSWQFRWGGVSFTEAMSSVHHAQYLYWYRFVMESVTSSRDVVWCCFE